MLLKGMATMDADRAHLPKADRARTWPKNHASSARAHGPRVNAARGQSLRDQPAPLTVAKSTSLFLGALLAEP
jgi:hypothetical protein